MRKQQLMRLAINWDNKNSFGKKFKPMDRTDIDNLYQRFNEESVSHQQIFTWLEQFEEADKPAALLLAGLIDYWGYKRVHFGLRSLHIRLMNRLIEDGFVPDFHAEHRYDQVDFSRSFCSKSGDLISYCYRKINGMRSLEFTNLEALDNCEEDISKRALVILDDYVGTGCQFLSFSYRDVHPELFNRFAKVYVATLVANNLAIENFKQVNQGNYEMLVQILSGVDEVNDQAEVDAIRSSFNKIHPGQCRLIYAQNEISLLDPASPLTKEEKRLIKNLITKYTHNEYCHGLFNVMSHNVFFFQCPNNAPQLLWDWDCGDEPGGWHPLFPRVSDSSIYAHDGNIPVLQQVAGRLWE